MRYLILVCVLFGCDKPVVDNRVADILSKVQVDNVSQTSVMLDRFDTLNVKLDADWCGGASGAALHSVAGNAFRRTSL